MYYIWHRYYVNQKRIISASGLMNELWSFYDDQKCSKQIQNSISSKFARPVPSKFHQKHQWEWRKTFFFKWLQSIDKENWHAYIVKKRKKRQLFITFFSRNSGIESLIIKNMGGSKYFAAVFFIWQPWLLIMIPWNYVL